MRSRWFVHMALLLVSGLITELLAQTRTQAVSERMQALRVLEHDVGAAYAQSGEPVKCGLSAITAAMRNRATLAPATRAALSQVMNREDRQTSILAGNFRIHFDTTGFNAPAMLDGSHQPISGTARIFVDSVATILSYVYAFETGVLNYDPPPTDGTLGGGPEYDIYILDMGFTYGETTPDTFGPDGGTSTTSITIDNDFTFVSPPGNKGLPALRVTLAHEFHHAIQIGRYGYWTSDSYYYEMTSTWMEDVLFTDVNDYYNYLTNRDGQFKNPNVSFTTANGMVEYSRAIWGHYVARKFGRDVMRETWEQIRQSRPMVAIDAALQQHSWGFASAFSEWTLWNYFTGSRSDSVKYYPEGRYYPQIYESVVEFQPPAREIPGPLPLQFTSSAYVEVLSAADTLTIVVSNTNFAATLSGLGGNNLYSLLLNAIRVDNAYVPTDAGIFVKLQVGDPGNWSTWFIVNNSPHSGSGAASLSEGTPFPNPFLADGRAHTAIPVTANGSVPGTLNIYSSSMDLVYSIAKHSTIANGRQVFEWDGKNDDRAVVSSGIYLFVLTLADRTITGKLAVIRK